MRGFVLAAGLGLLAAEAFAAEEQGAGLAGTTMVFMSGTCSSLIIGGSDMTSRCKPALINNAYRTGRSSFMFGMGDDTMVSFFGRDTAAVGNQATLYVDEVAVAKGKADGSADRVPHAVRGTCVYSNPNAGPTRIACRADGEGGSYAAEFLSDGEPPKIIRL